jgi:hypothetical protein
VDELEIVNDDQPDRLQLQNNLRPRRCPCLSYAIFDMPNDNLESTILDFGGKDQALHLGGTTK